MDRTSGCPTHGWIKPTHSVQHSRADLGASPSSRGCTTAPFSYPRGFFVVVCTYHTYTTKGLLVPINCLHDEIGVDPIEPI